MEIVSCRNLKRSKTKKLASYSSKDIFGKQNRTFRLNFEALDELEHAVSVITILENKNAPPMRVRFAQAKW